MTEEQRAAHAAFDQAYLAYKMAIETEQPHAAHAAFDQAYLAYKMAIETKQPQAELDRLLQLQQLASEAVVRATIKAGLPLEPP